MNSNLKLIEIDNLNQINYNFTNDKINLENYLDLIVDECKDMKSFNVTKGKLKVKLNSKVFKIIIIFIEKLNLFFILETESIVKEINFQMTKENNNNLNVINALIEISKYYDESVFADILLKLNISIDLVNKTLNNDISNETKEIIADIILINRKKKLSKANKQIKSVYKI